MSKKHVLGPFLTIFGHFCLMEIFPKSYITRYGPLTPCKVSETNELILRKLTDRQKDGQTLFYKTLPAKARGPIILSKILPHTGIEKQADSFVEVACHLFYE